MIGVVINRKYVLKLNSRISAYVGISTGWKMNEMNLAKR